MAGTSIPLAIKSPSIEDPLVAYGRAIGLRGALMQQQQEAQLAPLRQQQAQLAIQQGQIQVQQQQQAANDQKIIADAMRGAMSGPAQSPAPAASAAAQPAAVTPSQPSQSPTGSEAEEPTDDEASPAQATTPAGGPSAATAPQPAGVTPVPSPVLGAHAVDLVGVANKALANGLSYPAYQHMIQSAYENASGLAKMNETQRKDLQERHDGYLGRFMQFRAQPPDYQQQNWGAMNRQAFKDGLLTADEYTHTLQNDGKLPNDQDLDMWQAGLQTYSGQLASAEKIAQAQSHVATQNREAAQLPGEAAKSAIAQRASWASVLAQAKDRESYAGIYSQIPEEMRAGLVDPDQFDPQSTPGETLKWGMTPEQREMQRRADATAAALASHRRALEQQGDERTNIQRQRLGLESQRVGLESQRVGLEGERVRGTGTGGTPIGEFTGLKPSQVRVELDKIQSTEYGSGQNPGVHTERTTYGGYLAAGKGADGKPLTPELRKHYTDLYNNATQLAQQVQRKKAELAGVPFPPTPELVPEGQTMTDPRGHVWARKNGVTYMVR